MEVVQVIIDLLFVVAILFCFGSVQCWRKKHAELLKSLAISVIQIQDNEMKRNSIIAAIIAQMQANRQGIVLQSHLTNPDDTGSTTIN
jgi:hypothetical protein